MKALDWQRHIYLKGFSGKKPLVSTDFERLEAAALAKMPAEAAAYIAGGAGLQKTVRANRLGFDKHKILPAMLRNVENVDITTELFGKKLSSPLLLAPVGVLEMVHPDADLAVAKAAAAMQVPYIFSNQASVSMETCADAMGESVRFFQLYWSKSKELVINFLERAEKCGCTAIVLTLDTTMLGWRTRDLDLGYLPFLYGKGIAQYTSDPVFQQLLDDFLKEPSDAKPEITLDVLQNLISTVQNYPGKGFFRKLRSGRPLGAVRLFTQIYTNSATTWNDLAFLRSHTRLPIMLKGILHPDDARKALDYGMDGIIVSNHGGRQVDGSISTIEALPEIVKIAGEKIPVLLDSGIRSGADVFKALALGAKAVCIGRPYVYGLTLAGQAGVQEVIQHLLADFELTMRLSGCKNLIEIRENRLAKNEY